MSTDHTTYCQANQICQADARDARRAQQKRIQDAAYEWMTTKCHPGMTVRAQEIADAITTEDRKVSSISVSDALSHSNRFRRDFSDGSYWMIAPGYDTRIQSNPRSYRDQAAALVEMRGVVR